MISVMGEKAISVKKKKKIPPEKIANSRVVSHLNRVNRVKVADNPNLLFSSEIHFRHN